MKFWKHLIIAIYIQIFAIVRNIHIVTNRNDENTYINRINGNKNSIFSQVCQKILKTYHFIGNQGMDLYKYCSNEYELLSLNSNQIKKNNPFCLKNLNSFYCEYSIVESTKEIDEKAFCLSAFKKKRILEIIKGCINVSLI